MTIDIDAARLAGELDSLAAFSSAERPAVTRVVFSDADMRARAFVGGLCAEAGLAISIDAVGNTMARWVGSDSGAAAVATGSHIDAIPNAGRFDGTVGVLGGLEAIRALRRSGFTPTRSIELILFTSEEPTRFGIGCLGSRLLSGSLSPEAAAQRPDSDGRTLDAVRSAAGFDGPLGSVPLRAGAYSAFVELHIEQGPLLERDGVDVGIVTAIAAPASLRISIEGEGGHAGAVLMADRHDALVGAAEIILAVDNAARQTGSADTVATTGVCEVFPGAVNSVPSRVRLEVDVRDIQLARRDNVVRAIASASSRAARHRGVRVETDVINADPPAICADTVVNALTAAAVENGASHRRMISRAYHDSLFMSRVAPTGMVFIPCRDGVSHRPDEYASPAAIALGTAVLAGALARLSAAP